MENDFTVEFTEGDPDFFLGTCGKAMAAGEFIKQLRETINNLKALHRTISHMAAVNLPNTRTKVRELTDNKSLRVHYILKGISKEELSTQVYRRDNQRRKTTELLNVYELINVVGVELFTTLTNSDSTGKEYYDFRHRTIGQFQ